MRVLITGITGYIGSRLAARLAEEHQVFGLVRQPLNRTYLAELEDKLTLLSYDRSYESMEQALEQSKPELVYHLAAYYTGRHGREDTPALLESNVVLGGYLLEAMAACGCGALIYATSIMEHYEGGDYRPLNLYAATKRAFSDLLAYYTDAGIMKAGTLVLSDTYGPGDRRPKILNLIKDAAKSGEELALSAGTQDYDLVYIDDVVDAFSLAGQQLLEGAWKNRRFQICAESPLSLKKTVEKMLSVNDMVLNAAWGARPAAQRDMKQAVRCYPTVPGWKQRVPLDVGLKYFYKE